MVDDAQTQFVRGVVVTIVQRTCSIEPKLYLGQIILEDRLNKWERDRLETHYSQMYPKIESLTEIYFVHIIINFHFQKNQIKSTN